MSQQQLKKLEIDTRNAADIEALIADLSDQYDTGWTPDYDRPDIGTTIAKFYARSMEVITAYMLWKQKKVLL